jgi:predicted ferric reductase
VSQVQGNGQVTLLLHEKGDYTRKIGQIKKGSVLQLDGPFGRFSEILKNHQGPLVLYACGTGIAPLIGLAQGEASQRQLHLIWSTANRQRYLTHEIADLDKRGVRCDVQQHRFSNEQLAAILSAAEKEKATFLLVGSASVVLAVEKKLQRLGIARNQIFDERLTM